ncbi:TVP38/TMEM64 family protein [Anaerobacillus sp. MEB173]|uniref:TVP38/TMEM64 family protein n=1 Tax=Anaerobacillus sp. MEB173 TaxID=3383345 RepID=UPI003F8E9A8B
MTKKIGLAFVYLSIAFIIYYFGENILFWIQHHGNDFVILTSIVATLMALFPIIPYPIVGGIIGAAYGGVLGGLVTWIGSTLASLLMFLFVRYGYQDWGMKILHKYKTLGRVTVLFEQNAFMTIFISRLIPFIPSIIINVYSSLSRVTFISYAIASALGKIPAMILFAVVGDSLMNNPQSIFLTVFIYSVFLAIVYSFYRLWKRKTIAAATAKPSKI